MAEGFERAVVSAAPGSALLIHPGLSFYWPDTGLAMFSLYCWAAKLVIKVRNKHNWPLRSSLLLNFLVMRTLYVEIY